MHHEPLSITEFTTENIKKKAKDPLTKNQGKVEWDTKVVLNSQDLENFQRSLGVHKQQVIWDLLVKY